MSSKQNLPQEVFGYDPNKVPALIFGILYAILCIVTSFQLLRRKQYWGLCLPIGLAIFAVGFFLRFEVAMNPYSKGLFILEEMCTVVTPAAFLAFNYIIYGRILREAVGEETGFSLLKATKISTIFVLSDVFTFLMQTSGSGLLSSSNLATTGRRLVLIGLILQTASYLFFVVLVIFSHRKMARSGSFARADFPWFLFYILYFSSVGILIRGIFRITLFASASDSVLYTHEAFFYCLDSLPLFFATGVHAIWWPGNYFEKLSKPYSKDFEAWPLQSV